MTTTHIPLSPLKMDSGWPQGGGGGGVMWPVITKDRPIISDLSHL